jgi:2,3-dihydroxy-p-cumate/2,3-dihydroxybenzoate 3,4-dioxygenase
VIEIQQLRYVRLGTHNLPVAVDFAQRILGLQPIERSDEQATFRSDFRDHTLVYEVGDPMRQSVGLEVRTQAMLDRAIATLAANGITATAADAQTLARRKARAMASFRDHSGNTFELVVRPETSGWRYFPSRDAGVTGLAAVALRSTANEADETLWTTLFNGRVSDWVLEGCNASRWWASSKRIKAASPTVHDLHLGGLQEIHRLHDLIHAFDRVFKPGSSADLGPDVSHVCRT